MSDELIDHAAQILCDTSEHGARWADLAQVFRDMYRRRAQALVAAGLLTDDRQDELNQLRENLAIVSASAVRKQQHIDAVIMLLEQPGLSNLVDYQGFDGAYSQIRAALLDD